MRKSSYVSAAAVSRLRQILRCCPDSDVREEGLAQLRGRRQGGYIVNLFGSHPDAQTALRFVMQQQ